MALSHKQVKPWLEWLICYQSSCWLIASQMTNPFNSLLFNSTPVISEMRGFKLAAFYKLTAKCVCVFSYKE